MKSAHATAAADLRTLEIVETVIATGSMSVAASRFGITQSAVSQAVRRIEGLVGVRLLDRTVRPLLPTAAGQAFSREVASASQAFANALKAARLAAFQPERRELRLGMVDSFAGTVGAELVRELLGDATVSSLTAWSGLAGSHGQALTAREGELAISCDAMEGTPDLVHRHVFAEPFVLLVPEAAERELRDKSLRAILTTHLLVRHSARSHAGMQIERHLRRLDLERPKVLEFDTSDAVVAMVATGLGVAITTPLCILQGIAHARRVRVLPLPGPRLSRRLVAVARRGELDDLAPRIASSAHDLILHRGLPRLEAELPLAAKLAVDTDARFGDDT